jgi:hypothetical protein
MAQPGEFDVEGAEGEDGLEVRAASNDDPPIPPEPEERKPEPAPEVRRIGRPPKNRAPAVQAQGSLGAPNISVKAEDWPKDIAGLWMSILDWYKKENGGGPEKFILWVWQARGTMAPARMPQPIHGEQVAGSDEVTAGEALLELVTDVFHMPSTNDAASYQVEICLRSTGMKVRKSEMFRLDRPEQINRTRDAMRQRQAQSGSAQPFAYQQPRYISPAVYPPPPYPQGGGQSPPVAAASPPSPPQPPPTGNPYLDQYIDQLRRDKESAETRERDREYRQKEADEKHARDMAELRLEMQERLTVVTPPAAAPALTAPVESEDTKQAKLAATVAQSVMQTLIAAGVIGQKQPAATPVQPPMVVQPPPTPAQQAETVNQQRTTLNSMELILEEMERAEKLKKRMRSFLGYPEEEEEEEPETPSDIHVEPAVTERKTQRVAGVYKGGDIHLPVYTKDDDEVTYMRRVVDFFQVNPNVSSDVIQAVIGTAITKLAEGPLASLIPQLLQQTGAGAIAGNVLRGAVQGAAQAATNGAGSA